MASNTQSILDAYDASSRYLQTQEDLGTHLKKAFLLLARARMRVVSTQGGGIGPEHCRCDLGAARRLDKDGKLVTVVPPATPKERVDGWVEGEEEPVPTRVEDLALILAGGLAPAELKEAQQHFVRALETVVELAAAAQAIGRCTRAQKEGGEEEEER